MSVCYSCTEHFGIFRREHSCENCNFSFCSKCLSHKVVIPNKGSKSHPVCRPCYKNITDPPNAEKQNEVNRARNSPPENFKRRMEVLAAKQQNTDSASISLASDHVRPKTFNDRHKALAPEDRELVERLDRLKEDRKIQQGTIPSTEEMEQRLRILKGLPTSTSNPIVNQGTKTYFPPDNRNTVEQFQDLMEEMSAEIELEGKVDGNIESTAPGSSHESEQFPLPAGQINSDCKQLEDDVKRLMHEADEELRKVQHQEEVDADMAARLAVIQGHDPVKAKDNFKSKKIDYSSSDEDEETARNKLLKQIADEDQLDEKVKRSGNAEVLGQATKTYKEKQQDFPVDPEELPWCCICNEDALVRCLGCEGDLYCKKCFREGHDKLDREDHKTVRFKPPHSRMK